ncbi:efflux RND transporter periplasmic adaptor subunit [Dasania marina]|uniref:efflux RND transporter periplasmic adaptor subunit n=1 Tax=Dasania marina TaxID=471499 RepID=UPI0030DB3C91|tara:strand:- start:35724 stop:36776 length:1053 start_codon:yes stop_codon:yes gene_type:complete
MKPSLLLCLLAICTITACSKPSSEPVAEPVALITIAAVQSGDLPEIITSYGGVTFDPAKFQIINAEIESRVLEINALPGGTIKKGETVVRLGASEASRVEMERARRDATSVKAAADRAKRLRAGGLASDADVEIAVTTAHDLLDIATSLENRVNSIRSLVAPISGVVDAILVAPGDLVASGAMIARLASPDVIQAQVGVEIEDATRLSPGNLVSLQALDASRTTINTYILNIDMRIDPATRMANTLIAVPAGKGFFPGEAVRAKIIVATHANALYVPRQAVFRDESGTYVFVVDKDVALLTRVKTGLTSGNKTEILSGLTIQQRVVVEGAAILSDGMRVRTSASHTGNTK